MARRMAVQFSGVRSFSRYQRHRRTNRSCLPFVKLILSVTPALTGPEKVTVKVLPEIAAVLTVVPFGIDFRFSRLQAAQPVAIAGGEANPAGNVKASWFAAATVTTFSVVLG